MSHSLQPHGLYIVHGILQARILDWVAFPFSRGSSQPRDWTQVPHITGRCFTSWAPREALGFIWSKLKNHQWIFSQGGTWHARRQVLQSSWEEMTELYWFFPLGFGSLCPLSKDTLFSSSCNTNSRATFFRKPLWSLFLGWVRWPFLGVPQCHSWPPDCNYITVYKMCLLTCFPNSQTPPWVQGLRFLPPGSAYDQAQRRCSANMCGHELKDIIILTQWMPFNRNSRNTCQREVSTGCQRFCTEENNLPSWISCSNAWGISRS